MITTTKPCKCGGCSKCKEKAMPVTIDKDMIASLKEQVAIDIPAIDTSGPVGVIYVGGGKYWPGIVVGVRMLRRMGCSFPVEIWYRGQCEQVWPEDVEGLDVTLRDVDEEGSRTGVSSIPTGNVGSGGWEAKLTAMMLTSFSKVLYLDADAYVVADPTRWVGESNTLLTFWKDLPQNERTVKWERVLPHGGFTGVPQVQGGQLVIDRIKGSRMIHLANWMCQNSRYFFRHMYGDQDTWRVALAALKMAGQDSYYTCLGKAGWLNVAFTCVWENAPMVVHRCQGKLFEPRHIPPGRVKYSNPQYHLPREAEVFDIFAEVVNKREKNCTSVFSEIYKRKLWGSQPSGTGTKPKESQLYIDMVNRIAKEKGFSSAVDCGCGDGLVSSRLEFERYDGLDCCESMVKVSQTRYGGTRVVGLGKQVHRQYHTCDFIDASLIPSADVLLCKDVLHHWPRAMVTKWLDTVLVLRRWKAILLCQDDKQLHEEQECALGGYRALSPLMAPLNQYPLKVVGKVHHKTLSLISLTENSG